jgi:two-component system sensor histidine kinase YesM
MTWKPKPLRFTTRLTIIFLAFLMIPLLWLTYSNYITFKANATKQTLEMSEESLKQTGAFLNYTIASINNIIDAISFDETIQTLLSEGSSYDRVMEGNWYLQRTDVLNIIYNPYTTSELQSIRVFPLEGNESFQHTADYRTLTEEKRALWNTRIESLDLFKMILVPSTLFSGEKPTTISLVKRVPDFKSINKFIGIIKGEIPQSVFQSIIESAALYNHSQIALYNAYGELIASTAGTIETNIPGIEELIQQNEIMGNGRLQRIKIDGEWHFIGLIRLASSEWNLVQIIPETYVIIAATAYRKRMLWTIALLLGAMIPLSSYITKTVTHRIRKLHSHIAQSQEQGFEIERLENGSDEIGELTRAYDDMAENLRVLLREQFQLGYQIKHLEFKVLQATIDPHFLYNTLDLMHWKALKNKDEDSANLALSLSKFYKLSLGGGQSIVMLSQELEHVRMYVQIQNIRFDGNIHLDIECPPNLMGQPVFKIMLQPIVENAILHGIRERPDATGTILIRAQQDGEALVVTVCDNGVGMSGETIVTLLNPANKDTGYGVWNIHERIRLTHGDEYGLRFTSTLGIGTVVTIRIPMSPALHGAGQEDGLGEPNVGGGQPHCQ